MSTLTHALARISQDTVVPCIRVFVAIYSPHASSKIPHIAMSMIFFFLLFMLNLRISITMVLMDMKHLVSAFQARNLSADIYINPFTTGVLIVIGPIHV